MLLERVLEGALSAGANVSKIFVRDLNISGCLNCGECNETGLCVVEDDMHRMYSELLEADIIVIATPIFFYGMTSQIKAFIDRSQCFWARKYLLKKPVPPSAQGRKRKGALVAVGGSKGKNIFTGPTFTAKYFFELLGIESFETLLFNRIDQKGAVKEHPTALDEAFDLGRRLVLDCPED